jgi:F-type H+-transporting ATPase subunit b
VRTLLSIHLPTFIFAIINLGILYWFLKKVLFGPVTKFMENRTKNIANSIQTAEQKLAEAEAMKENYENQLQNAKEQADAILKEARDRGAREYDNLIGQAKAESQEIIDRAREDMENERQQMFKEVRNEVASLALAAASKIIEANMDNEKNRKLVDKFINEEGAA